MRGATASLRTRALLRVIITITITTLAVLTVYIWSLHAICHSTLRAFVFRHLYLLGCFVSYSFVLYSCWLSVSCSASHICTSSIQCCHTPNPCVANIIILHHTWNTPFGPFSITQYIYTNGMLYFTDGWPSGMLVTILRACLRREQIFVPFAYESVITSPIICADHSINEHRGRGCYCDGYHSINTATAGNRVVKT